MHSAAVRLEVSVLYMLARFVRCRANRATAVPNGEMTKEKGREKKSLKTEALTERDQHAL